MAYLITRRYIRYFLLTCPNDKILDYCKSLEVNEHLIWKALLQELFITRSQDHNLILAVIDIAEGVNQPDCLLSLGLISGNLEIVKLLVTKGYSLQNYYGPRTCWQYAMESGSSELFDWLLRQGCKWYTYNYTQAVYNNAIAFINWAIDKKLPYDFTLKATLHNKLVTSRVKQQVSKLFHS